MHMISGYFRFFLILLQFPWVLRCQNRVKSCRRFKPGTVVWPWAVTIKLFLIFFFSLFFPLFVASLIHPVPFTQITFRSDILRYKLRTFRSNLLARFSLCPIIPDISLVLPSCPASWSRGLWISVPPVLSVCRPLSKTPQRLAALAVLRPLPFLFRLFQFARSLHDAKPPDVLRFLCGRCP